VTVAAAARIKPDQDGLEVAEAVAQRERREVESDRADRGSRTLGIGRTR
jgi:hypothetical protein